MKTAHAFIRRIPALAALATLLACVSTVSAQTVTLQDVSYAVTGGDRAQLTLTFSGPAPKPMAFTLENPPRLALDLPGTGMGSLPKTQQLAGGIAHNLRAAQAGNRTRLVVGLDRVVPYDVRVQNNRVHVALGTGPAGARQAAASTPGDRAPAAAVDEAKRITNIDFHRAEKGTGRVVITLSSPAVTADLQTRGKSLLLDFYDARLPEELVRRLDVTDFATPVRTIDSANREGHARLVITPEGDYEHLAFQVGNVYTVDVRPVTPEEKAARLQEEYTGEKLSLNFQNIDVRAVLQLIGDFTGLNVVASDTVRGNLTLRLKNVPWDQALDIILKSKGLGMRRNGNVMLIAPSEELAAREKLELEAQQQLTDLAPLRTEFFDINYAKASEIAALLKAERNSLLSSRGNITIDERTNTLMILDTAEKLDEIRRVLTRLDVPVRQVLIESRVVIANDDFSKSLGTRFGATYVGRNGGRGLVTSSGSAAGTNTTVSSGLDNLAAGRDVFDPAVAVPGLGDRLNVNLPVPAAGSIALAILGADYIVDLELSAMQSEGRGELISSPRVVTANQKKALIEQGVDIPYLEASSSGATSVSFKKAVLSLAVTPQITPDDRVIMDLEVNKDSVGQIFSGVPSVDTRAVQTQVLVENGDTVVLGGIYEQARNESVDKVPLLGDIPVLGALFRRTQKVDDKAELLIFVTPKILKEGLKADLQ
ncbi:MAG: type IV pilus secretin PilQ [Thiohalomonadaceae bacterium]